MPREREILPRDNRSAKVAGCLCIQFNVLTPPKSMYLCPISSPTPFPACPIVVHIDREQHLTTQNPWRSISSGNPPKTCIKMRKSATRLLLPSSHLSSQAPLHRSSTVTQPPHFENQLINHLQYATPHYHSRSYSIGFRN